jgi:VanZ family protein
MKTSHNVKRPDKRRAAVLWSATAVLMAVIFYFSSLEDTELSGGFLSYIFRFFSDECSGQLYLPLFFDKLFHTCIYAVLGFLFYFSLRESGFYRHLFLLSVLLAVSYGITDEFHQSFVPGRLASAGDLLANLAGAMLGGFAAGMLVSVRKKQAN